jgi:Reverse transcriptase (RNA-dependent DNA polymerase)
MFKSIQMLLSIVAFHDYEIWQMNVKTVFLNGNLEDDVHMIQPTGFEDPKNAGKVSKLLRSIYGLKQVSRSWNLRFDEEVRKFDFIKCEEEPCVYRKTSGSAIAFLILYVDDILMGIDIPLL